MPPQTPAIPPHHDWFLSQCCAGDHQRYLQERRLLEITLHDPRTLAAAPVSKPPAMSARFDDPSWSAAQPSGSFTINGSHAFNGPPRGTTLLKALRHGPDLFIALHCEDPAGIAKMPPKNHPLFNGRNADHIPRCTDFVSIAFDPTHEHSHFVELIATPSGGKAAVVGHRNFVLHPSNPLRTAHKEWEMSKAWCRQWDLAVSVAPGRRSWTAMFRVPLSLILSAAPPVPTFEPKPRGPAQKPPTRVEDLPGVIGFNAHRFKHSAVPEQSVWSPVRWFGENVRAPMRFGDLYLTDVPLRIGPLWLGSCRHGQNHITADVQNLSPKPIRVCWTTEAGLDDARRPSARTSATTLRPGANRVEIPYWFANAGWWTLRLRAALADAGRASTGKRAARAPTPAQFFNILHWLQAYPRIGGKVALPASATYSQRRQNALASRLPRLVRLTTADGAPSDFCLRSTDGRWQVNLMEPGAFKRIVAMINARFKDEDERLAAAALFSLSPDVIVYDADGNFNELTGSPLSVMRLGTGICGARGLLVAGLIEALTPPGGGRYLAYRCGVGRLQCVAGRIDLRTAEGHTVVAVYTPDGRTLILDNGNNHFNARTGRLLQLSESAQRRQADRRMSRPADAFMLHQGTHAWPMGAPAF